MIVPTVSGGRANVVLVSDLINAVKRATVEKEVLVKSRDYYARDTDYETTTIKFVDADKLLEQLEALDYL